jgi:hypothetical protein
VIHAVINYVERGPDRPFYYANDHARDNVPIDGKTMALANGRDAGPRLDIEGFVLVPHPSSVVDFRSADTATLHAPEICALLRDQTGADHIAVTAPPIFRFSEKSGLAGALNNSMPARFAHIDVTTATAESFAARATPAGRTVTRFAQYNIWRAISTPPQDVPLAVCDYRSVTPADLVEADAIFDEAGKPEWSFASWVIAHNPDHRWHWFSDMTRDEALIFKTHDSDPSRARFVPHVAFDHPDCPADAPPRVSIEMRATAFWFV